MRQDQLSPPPGSKKNRKRIGRGDSSGHGSFSTRGAKGQNSRSGSSKLRPGFEGGQLPMLKRLPEKRGFFNRFRTEYSVVNIDKLSVFTSGSEVTPEKLLEAGLLKSLDKPVKILATGDISQPLVVKANKFSAAARAKIEAAGGKAEEVGHASESK
jgi:large subunit ribosomal protein L15